MSVCNLCNKNICQLHQKINEVIGKGINKENIEYAVYLREKIKHRENELRIKRQELDNLIYNNIKLLT
jgi:hypothetical protein